MSASANSVRAPTARGLSASRTLSPAAQRARGGGAPGSRSVSPSHRLPASASSAAPAVPPRTVIVPVLPFSAAAESLASQTFAPPAVLSPAHVLPSTGASASPSASHASPRASAGEAPPSYALIDSEVAAFDNVSVHYSVAGGAMPSTFWPNALLESFDTERTASEAALLRGGANSALSVAGGAHPAREARDHAIRQYMSEQQASMGQHGFASLSTDMSRRLQVGVRVPPLRGLVYPPTSVVQDTLKHRMLGSDTSLPADEEHELVLTRSTSVGTSASGNSSDQLVGIPLADILATSPLHTQFDLGSVKPPSHSLLFQHASGFRGSYGLPSVHLVSSARYNLALTAAAYTVGTLGLVIKPRAYGRVGRCISMSTCPLYIAPEATASDCDEVTGSGWLPIHAADGTELHHRVASSAAFSRNECTGYDVDCGIPVPTHGDAPNFYGEEPAPVSRGRRSSAQFTDNPLRASRLGLDRSQPSPRTAPNLKAAAGGGDAQSSDAIFGTSRLQHAYKLHNSAITCTALHPVLPVVASAAQQVIHFWRADTQSDVLQPLVITHLSPAQFVYVVALTFSPCGRWLYVLLHYLPNEVGIASSQGAATTGGAEMGAGLEAAGAASGFVSPTSVSAAVGVAESVAGVVPTFTGASQPQYQVAMWDMCAGEQPLGTMSPPVAHDDASGDARMQSFKDSVLTLHELPSAPALVIPPLDLLASRTEVLFDLQTVDASMRPVASVLDDLRAWQQQHRLVVVGSEGVRFFDISLYTTRAQLDELNVIADTVGMQSISYVRKLLKRSMVLDAVPGLATPTSYIEKELLLSSPLAITCCTTRLLQPDLDIVLVGTSNGYLCTFVRGVLVSCNAIGPLAITCVSVLLHVGPSDGAASPAQSVAGECMHQLDVLLGLKNGSVRLATLSIFVEAAAITHLSAAAPTREEATIAQQVASAYASSTREGAGEAAATVRSGVSPTTAQYAVRLERVDALFMPRALVAYLVCAVSEVEWSSDTSARDTGTHAPERDARATVAATTLTTATSSEETHAPAGRVGNLLLLVGTADNCLLRLTCAVHANAAAGSRFSDWSFELLEGATCGKALCVATHPLLPLAFSGSADGYVQVWDTLTSSCISCYAVQPPCP
ncbi:MAG: hypothetical protein EOO41_00560, partial [Methanobacteriota archaeon]